MNSLVLGIGGFGCSATERLYAAQKGESSDCARLLALDSDLNFLEDLADIPKIPMTERVSVGNAVEKLGKATVCEWFPTREGEYYNRLDMSRGANGWRLKGLLSFECMLADGEKKERFDYELKKLLEGDAENDEDSEIPELFIVASGCGGTGGGAFLPVALYAKRFAEARCKKIKIYCILACADIFAELLTAENRVKAYANEYAALRELNAVLRLYSANNGKNGKTAETRNADGEKSGGADGENADLEENDEQGGFKIGSASSRGMGLLFDGVNAPTKTPFTDGVYLIDKTAGLRGVKEYEEKTLKIISVIRSGLLPKTETRTVYRTAAFAETIYPYETFAEYAAYELTLESVKNEWLYIHSSAEKTLARHNAVLRENGYNAENTAKDYAEAVINFYKENCSETEISEKLATGHGNEENAESRESGDAESDPYIKFADTEDVVREIKTSLSELFDKEDAAETVETARKDLKTLEPIKLFDGKAVKEEKKGKLVSLAAYYYNFLVNYYENEITALPENVKRAAELLESERFSLKENLTRINGRRIHPATSLVMLADLSLGLANAYKTAKFPKRDFFELKKGKLPESVCGALERGGSTAYLSYDGNRLLALAEGHTELLSKDLLRDGANVAEDFERLYGEIRSNITVVYFTEICKKVESVLKEYREIFGALEFILQNADVDEKLKLIAGTADSGVTAYVGASVENKKAVYEEVKKEAENDRTLRETAGKAFCEIVWEELLTDNDKTESSGDKEEERDSGKVTESAGEAASETADGDGKNTANSARKIGEELFSRLVGKYKERAESYGVIRRAKSLDILRVLHDEDIFKDELPENSESGAFRKAFAANALPFDITEKEGEKHAVTRNFVLVPKESEAFAEKFAENGEKGAEAVKAYAARQGNYENEVYSTSVVPSNKIVAIKETAGFELYAFNKANDGDDEAEYYKNYRKARSVCAGQFSEMWNPYIGANVSEYDLPFINPEKQKTYEENVLKAFLYLLERGFVTIRSDDKIYYECFVTGDSRERAFGGETKNSDEWKAKLLKYIAENGEIADKYGKNFDEYTDYAAANLPVPLVTEKGLKTFAKSITESSPITFLTGNVLDKIRSFMPMDKENAAEALKDASSGFGGEKKTERIFLKVVREIAEKMILRKLDKEKNEEAIEVLRNATYKELRAANPAFKKL